MSVAERQQNDGYEKRGDTRSSGRRGRSGRDHDIVDMLVSGTTVSHVGRAHGYSSAGASLRLIDRALDAVLPLLDPDQQRRIDLARLDRILQAWWAPALDGDLDAARLVLATIECRARLGHAGDPQSWPGGSVG